MSKRTYHIISHTHWDREWYLPYEQFRIRLVELIDTLLDIFRREPRYKHFLLDGQSIILEDYLEIKPENESALKALIKKGKISAGPWYVLADEFLVSGEALIRNLLIGRKVTDKLGKVINIGYVPDTFGHISQLPQILRGFGIDNVFLSRGFGGEEKQSVSEYNWKAPDNSEILMVHFPKGGYTFGKTLPAEPEFIKQRLEQLEKLLLPRAQTPHLIIMNGSDHLWPQKELPKIIKIMSELHPKDKFIHSTLENYISSVKRTRKTFPPIQGELRFGFRYTYLLQGVYSSRMYLKQTNTLCQRILERCAEPFGAIAFINGYPDMLPFIEKSWKYLLQNHPHDSICGCSVDSVHQEMMTRFNKSLQIAESVTDKSLKLFAFGNNNKTTWERPFYLFVFNPSPFARTEPIECKIDFALQDVRIGCDSSIQDTAKKDDIKGFRILDPKGTEIHYQIINSEEVYARVDCKYTDPEQKVVRRYHLLIDAKDIPPLGFKAFKIEESSQTSQFKGEISVSDNKLENEFISVAVSKNGSIMILHKGTNARYGPFNIFEDSTDVGDEYNYSYPANDEYYYSTQFKPIIRVLENGPLRGIIEIVYRMILPKKAASDENRRVKDKKELLIITKVILATGMKRVDFQTIIDNNIKDHRLRACFELGEATKTSYADSTFHIIKRLHKEYNPAEFKLECPTKTHPMQEFVAISGIKKAFTLISDGLPEYELKLDGKGTLALTLLRCVGKLSGSNLITRKGDAGWKNDTPDAQCQGIFKARYSIFPHDPKEIDNWGHVLQEVEKHNLKMLHLQRPAAQLGSRSLEKWFLSIEPSCIRFSALKPPQKGKGYVLRYWNPTGKEINVEIKFAEAPKSAHYLMLSEKRGKPISINKNGSILTKIGPHKIQSILIKK